MPKIDRQAVYAKCNGCCAYCGAPLERLAMQIDHVRPQAYGGSDDLGNLLPACRACNNYKAVWSLDQFRNVIAGQIYQLRKYSMNFRTAERFGMVVVIQKPTVFHFERDGLQHGAPPSD